MKKTIMVVLGRGGHTNQMLNLVDKLGNKYNYEYVIGANDRFSEKNISIPGRVFRVYNPREMNDKSKLVVFLKLIKTSLQSIKMFFKSKAKTIIACGPGLAIPVCVLGKILFWKKLIFIESWSRVYSKSLSGKFLYPISDRSFIQWESQKKNYPKAIYAGRLG